MGVHLKEGGGQLNEIRLGHTGWAKWPKPFPNEKNNLKP